jgi:hypothetical protein
VDKGDVDGCDGNAKETCLDAVTNLVEYFARSVRERNRLLKPFADLFQPLCLVPVVEGTRHIDLAGGVRPIG